MTTINKILQPQVNNLDKKNTSKKTEVEVNSNVSQEKQVISDKVTLSKASLSTDFEINQDKIQEIKQAIAQGTFKINPNKIKSIKIRVFDVANF